MTLLAQLRRRRPVDVEAPPVLPRELNGFDQRTLGQFASARHHADRVLPPTVAEFVRRELLAAERFGYMPDPTGLTRRLAVEVIALGEQHSAGA